MDSQSSFYRDTWAEINLDHVSYNVKGMRRILPKDVQLIAVVKANAYGHGDAAVAQTALDSGASYLAVAFLDEALTLRNKGITAPILVLGASRPEDSGIAASNYITLTAYQAEWIGKAKDHLQANQELIVHLKFDTGMGRLGIRSKNELAEIEAIAENDSRIRVEGAFTHFATADELDTSYFRQQLQLFKNMLSWFKVKPPMIHSGNSAASLRFPETHFNAVRMGISMYGLTPSLEIAGELPFPLRQAFSLHTKITHVKKVPKGGKVSYGAAYEAIDDEWIGTLPIGYADGWIRRLQGQEVLINGVRVPIVGRICMDQCMVRLPEEVPPGTAVTLIGQQGSAEITADEIAQKLETINYEVTCMIGARVPRVYKKAGKTVGIINSIL